MTDRRRAQPAAPTAGAAPTGRRAAVLGVVLALVFGLLGAGLVALVLVGRSDTAGAGATPPPTLAPAAALELTDQDGRAFALSSQLGRPVLVFFGYTHCPDVCPTTVGIVNEVLLEVGDGPRAVFVSIDPERDDVAAMRSYLRYLPDAYIGLTGTPQQVRENANRWGVQYARMDQDSAAGYAMAHTADLFLVDARGILRARFPFGTEAEPMAEAVRSLLAEVPPVTAATATPAAPSALAGGPTPTVAPTALPTPAGAAALYPEVISSSIWAGGAGPVILRATDGTGAALDGSAPVSVQLVSPDGTPRAEPVAAQVVRPRGEQEAYLVADLAIPASGAWRVRLTAERATGETTIQALDPGTTAPIGRPAPGVDTPTLDDVGGVVRAVTTQPQPDLRLSRTSTADALATGRPYVLVVDSARFKVSPECGRALTMIRYLLDRWAEGVVFVHLEPFEYQVVSEEPVLAGSLEDPPLNEYAAAYGLGDATWPATRMPWVFVVDGQGIVQAKYTGIVGSADIDVILTRIAGG